MDEEAREKYEGLIIDFIDTEYLDILASAGYHILYKYDARQTATAKLFGPDSERDVVDIDGSETVGGSDNAIRLAAWEEITKSNMYGYDQLTALSQTAINNHLHHLWLGSKSSLANGVDTSNLEAIDIVREWIHPDGAFHAEFKAPTVRFGSISQTRPGYAVIFIDIVKGTLKPLRNRAPFLEYDVFPFHTSNISSKL